MVQANNVPFKFQEVFNLTTKGLDANNFKMGLMTFESQKYICVKEGQVSYKIECHSRHCFLTCLDYRTNHQFNAAENAPKRPRASSSGLKDCVASDLAFVSCLCSKSPSSTLPTASMSRNAT